MSEEPASASLGSIIIQSIIIGAAAAIAAVIAEKLITGEVTPAIAGGVAGAVTATTVGLRNRKKADKSATGN